MNQTNRVYRFHEVVPMSDATLRRRSPSYLDRIVERVWERYGRGPRPVVYYPRSYEDGLFETSFYNTERGTKMPVIFIAPHQRNLQVLLHELAHALTPREKAGHGPRFMEVYIRLMVEFARASEEELLINAGLFGVRVHGFTKH